MIDKKCEHCGCYYGPTVFFGKDRVCCKCKKRNKKPKRDLLKSLL